jgi:hypothetical protein
LSSGIDLPLWILLDVLNRFPGHSLCYIDNIAFVVSPAALKIGYSIFLAALVIAVWAVI